MFHLLNITNKIDRPATSTKRQNMNVDKDLQKLLSKSPTTTINGCLVELSRNPWEFGHAIFPHGRNGTMFVSHAWTYKGLVRFIHRYCEPSAPQAWQ